MADPNIPQVQIAPKGFVELIQETVLKQGPLAIFLSFGIWYLWGQIDKARVDHNGVVVKIEEQHTANLSNQAAAFKEELARTERLLTSQIKKNASAIEETATRTEAIAAKVETMGTTP